MKRVLVSACLVLISSGLFAAELSQVNVTAPDVNCVFDPDCTISVIDTSDVIDLPGGAGTGFLQSRIFDGQPGSPADGLFGYEYRIDLRNIAGILDIPCVVTFAIDFGPTVPLDYDGNGETEHVYVITQGGLGSVGPDYVDKTGDRISFHFYGGACAGESTYFIGMASRTASRSSSSRLTEAVSGMVLDITAVVPAIPRCPPRPDLNDDLSGAQRDVLDDLVRNYITEPIIHTHFTPGIHSTATLLPWHRTFIGGLENSLILQGHPEFVPLPKWDPAKPIPAEFQSIDADCFLSADPGNCNALSNTNPNVPLPAHATHPDVCDYATRDELTTGGVDGARPGVNGWHGGVHCTIGGNMCTYRSPAAEIFWEWHAFLDDIWKQWSCRCFPFFTFELAPLPEDLLTPCLLTPCWVGWWQLEDPHIFDPFELEPVTFLDLRGEVNTAIPVGNPLPIPGKVGGALSFDGIGDFLRVPDHPELSPGLADLSIDAWVRTSAAGLQPLVDKRDATGAGYALFLQDGLLSFEMRPSAGAGQGVCDSSTGLCTAPAASVGNNCIVDADCDNGLIQSVSAVAGPGTLMVADGKWHHVAVSVDRDDVRGGRLFVDGQVVHTFDPTAAQGDINCRTDLFIGRSQPTANNPNGVHFAGAIDEVDLLRRILKSDEVAGIHAADEAGKLGALVGVSQIVFPEICSSAAFGEPGQQTTVPITLADGSGIAGFQVDVSFDPSVLMPAGVQLGAETAAAGGWTVTSAIVGTGVLRVLGFSDPPTGLGPAISEIALVQFDVAAGAPTGTTPLSQSDCVLSDDEGLAIPCDLCPNPGGVLVRPASSFDFGPIVDPIGVDVFDPLPFPASVQALDSLGNVAAGYARTADMDVTNAGCAGTLEPATLPFVNGQATDTFAIRCCMETLAPATSIQLMLEASDAPLSITGTSDPFLGVAKGDVDASGGRDVLDVTRAVIMALNQTVATPPPANFQSWAANMPDQLCSVDASTNVLDVVRIKNLALGREPLCPCEGPVFELTAAPEERAAPLGVTLLKVGPRDLLVMVEGAANLGGLQLELRGVGKAVTMTTEGLTAGASWQVFAEEKDRGNRLRVITFGNTDQGIAGNGPVLRISGAGRPKLVGVIASDAMGRAIDVR